MLVWNEAKINCGVSRCVIITETTVSFVLERNMKNRFYIKHYRDYHEIEAPEGYQAIELGCFPNDDAGCCRYFGLYYKGRKPSLARVLNSLLKKVDLGEFFHYRTDNDIGITKKDLIEEVKSNLNDQQE